jgi:hypothetical protein
MSESARHLRSVQPTTGQVGTERAIPVRFTSTAGLITPIRNPLNSFRWVGPGTLRVSEHGIIVTAKRVTLLGLRPVEQFFPAALIRDVYREGGAVQVHLREPRNAYFRLWAEDPASAAQLVALLPTRQTIEFDSEFSEPQVAATRHLPKGLLVSLLIVVAVTGFFWFALHRPEAQHTLRPPPPAAAALPAAGPSPAHASVPPEDVLRAKQDLAQFDARISTLEAEFASALDALMDGSVSQQKFADELEQWLLPQWDDLEARLRRSGAAPHSLQERADNDLMAAINNWQLATRTYADDLRKQRFVQRPFEYMGHAERHLWRAEELQARLERGPPYDLEQSR